MLVDIKEKIAVGGDRTSQVHLDDCGEIIYEIVEYIFIGTDIAWTNKQGREKVGCHQHEADKRGPGDGSDDAKSLHGR